MFSSVLIKAVPPSQDTKSKLNSIAGKIVLCSHLSLPETVERENNRSWGMGSHFQEGWEKLGEGSSIVKKVPAREECYFRRFDNVNFR